jgi:hypothetical protein
MLFVMLFQLIEFLSLEFILSEMFTSKVRFIFLLHVELLTFELIYKRRITTTHDIPRQHPLIINCAFSRSYLNLIDANTGTDNYDIRLGHRH